MQKYSSSCTENDSVFNLPNQSEKNSVESSSLPSNKIDDDDDNGAGDSSEATVLAKPMDDDDDTYDDKSENVIVEGNLSEEEPQDLCRSDDKVRCAKTSSVYICDVQKCDGNRDCPGGEDEENCPNDESNVQEGSGEAIEVGTKDEVDAVVENRSEESAVENSIENTEGELLKSYNLLCRYFPCFYFFTHLFNLYKAFVFMSLTFFLTLLTT